MNPANYKLKTESKPITTAENIKEEMPIFLLKNLPYGYDMLEPFLSAKTLDTHHQKHHGGYVKKLNELIAGGEYKGKATTLEGLIRESRELVEARTNIYREIASINKQIFDNASQIWNHEFYWESMTNEESRQSIQFELGISREDLKQEFIEKAKKHFGSGYVWIVRTPNHRIEVKVTHDAENPVGTKDTAIVGCDLWEHAYYLDYQNLREEYLEKFWDKIDWVKGQERLK